MNPITNIKNQNKLNERELASGTAGHLNKSWHSKYIKSAWIFAGGLPFDVNEGDVIAIFSQYGEIVNVNLVRDRKTGKSKGFAFICYQDQRSTILAVDNFNGTKICGRMIRVDHVEEYKVPKYKEDIDEETRRIWEEGCAPKPMELTVPEVDEEEEQLRKRLNKHGLIPLKDVDPDLKAKIKQDKKAAKQAKKAAKAARAEERRIATEMEKPRDLTRSWKEQKLFGDTTGEHLMPDDQFYGSHSAFNFGKQRKELPPAPTHNIRPDFDKADWRDVEMFRIVREREKREKGEEGGSKPEEEHYLPKRFRRE